MDSPRWRAGWDQAIIWGSALPALLWGTTAPTAPTAHAGRPASGSAPAGTGEPWAR